MPNLRCQEQQQRRIRQRQRAPSSLSSLHLHVALRQATALHVASLFNTCALSMILLISVASCSADFVTAFQLPSSVQRSSRARQHIRSTKCGDFGAGCTSSVPSQATGSALNMFPLADIVEHAADFSSNMNAGTNFMLLDSTASSSAATSTTTMISSLDVNDLLYKAQSMASDMASSSGIFGGSASGLSEGGGVGSGAGASGGITATSLAILYGAGLLTSFSPCSLSLLPLTVSYISASTTEQRNAAVGSDNLQQSSAPSSLLSTLAFAAGLASVFVGLGLSVALAGAGVFGATTQGSDDGTMDIGKLLLAALSSGVSIAMGLQLLELIRIPLPSFELDVDQLMTSDTRGTSTTDDNVDVAESGSEIAFDDDGNLIPVAVASVSDADDSAESSSTTTGGSLLRTFLLGGSSALIASPCATPVLTSILAYVATSRDPIIGAILLFTYTVGYSTPLLVIGATGGQALANAQAAAASGDDDTEGGGGGMSLAMIGRLVTPLTASVLIWYGTTGFLEALIGDPSLVALAPILD